MKKLLPIFAILPLLIAGCLSGGNSASGSTGSTGNGSTSNGSSANSGSPNNSIAVLGDSYSAGEGTGGVTGENFIPSTDVGNFAGQNPMNLSLGDACHRSTVSYAIKIFNVNPDLFFACSGASSGDMDTLPCPKSEANPDGMHMPVCPGVTVPSFRDDTDVTQVRRLLLNGDPNPNLKTVIISVGGDDMGFAGVLTACTSTFNIKAPSWSPWQFKLEIGPLAPFLGSGATPGVCQTAIEQDEAGTNPLPNGSTGYSGGFAALHDNLVTLYGNIHSAAPDAHIYTVGYPHIFPLHGHSGCNGIAPVDQIALNNATNDLNDVINTAASDYSSGTPNAGQVTFVDTTNVMNGHFICGDSDGWINDLQLTSNLNSPNGNHIGPFNCAYKNVAQWIQTKGVDIGVCSQSFHPTAEGAIALGQKVQQCINTPASCEANPSPDAIAAWNATDGGCAATMAASLHKVAGLLPSSDPTQKADLNQLAGFPLSELSGAQETQGQADLNALNAFFGTSRELTTFTGPCPVTTPPVDNGSTAVPGNDSPADAVDGFYQNELAGDWSAVCSYVTPSAQDLCRLGTIGQGPATGQVTVGTAVISGTEALVPVTGNICAPSSPCVSNDDPATGMPLGPEEFAADYQAAVANSTGSTTVLSPMPVSEIGGKWYVDFG